MRIEALAKDNFDTWKLQVRALLVKNDAWDYVSGEKVKPEIVQGDAKCCFDSCSTCMGRRGQEGTLGLGTGHSTV